MKSKNIICVLAAFTLALSSAGIASFAEESSEPTESVAESEVDSVDSEEADESSETESTADESTPDESSSEEDSSAPDESVPDSEPDSEQSKEDILKEIEPMIKDDFTFDNGLLVFDSVAFDDNGDVVAKVNCGNILAAYDNASDKYEDGDKDQMHAFIQMFDYALPEKVSGYADIFSNAGYDTNVSVNLYTDELGGESFICNRITNINYDSKYFFVYAYTLYELDIISDKNGTDSRAKDILDYAGGKMTEDDTYLVELNFKDIKKFYNDYGDECKKYITTTIDTLTGKDGFPKLSEDGKKYGATDKFALKITDGSDKTVAYLYEDGKVVTDEIEKYYVKDESSSTPDSSSKPNNNSGNGGGGNNGGGSAAAAKDTNPETGAAAAAMGAVTLVAAAIVVTKKNK